MALELPPGFQPSLRPAAPRSDLPPGFQPARAPPDSDVVAHAASGASGEQAAQAVDVAAQTGTTPDYVAQDLPGALDARIRARFANQLKGRPALTAWASQSPQHAAVVKAHAGPLGQIADWFSGLGSALYTGVADISHAEAMRQRMNGGGWAADAALPLEDDIADFEATKPGVVQSIVRAAPAMTLFGGAASLGGPVGLAGLLYAQNKGVLARQIELAQIARQKGDMEQAAEDEAVGIKSTKPATEDLTPAQIDNYAMVGSGVAAVTLAGMLGPLVRTLPGAKPAAQAAVASVLKRAAMTTAGQAAIRALSAYGSHTLMGAVGMTLQATVNSATVQKAVTGEVDAGQLAREGADTFVKVLPVAAAFAVYGPGREFLEDRARIQGAPLEVAKMDAMVKAARDTGLVRSFPDQAADLFGSLGKGAMVYIRHAAAAKLEALSPEARAEATATQGSVAVPLPEYLARLSDQHESLRDDVSMSADGYTMAEARFRDKEMRQALDPKAARSLYGKMSPDEMQKLDLPIAADMSAGWARNLESLGWTPPAKAGEAKTANQRTPPAPEPAKTPAPAQVNTPGGTVASPPLHELMAAEYGGKADEWAKMLTPELMGALNEEGTVGAISPEEHAARRVEAMLIGQIKPEPFERQANKSIKYIQKAAEDARTGEVAGVRGARPRDVAVLHTYELARDVNKALAERAAAVQEEMAKTSEDIAAKAVDQKLRAQMSLAAPPVLHLFDALTEGTSISPVRQGWVSAHQEAVEGGAAPYSPDATNYADSRMRGALDEARQWMDMSAHAPFGDADALADFLAKPRPWAELTPSEARNIADAVNQLAKVAKVEASVRRGDERATTRDKADQIRGELRQNPSKGLPIPSGVEPTWTQSVLADANAANAILSRVKNLLRRKSETATGWLFDPINQGLYDRNDLMREFGQKFAATADALPKEMSARSGETYDLSADLPTPGMQPLTAAPRTFLWKLAQHRMSAGNMDRVVSMNGWDPSTIDRILFDDSKTKLSEAEWDHLQTRADVQEGIWKKLKAHLETYEGLAPPKTAAVPFKVQLADGSWKEYAGGYHPLRRDTRLGVAPPVEQTQGVARLWGPDLQLPSRPGQANDRVEGARYTVNMDWDSDRSAVSQTLHFLALDQPVRSVNRLLADPALAADMREFLGEGATKIVNGWVQSVASHGLQTVPQGMELVQRAFGGMRKLQLVQIVGGSARLATSAALHPLGLMLGGEVNPLHGVPALLSIFKPLTLESGEVRLMPNWNDAAINGKEVQKRADNAYTALRSGWDASSAPSGPLGALRDLALKTGGLFMHAADRLTTTWAWTSFHNEAVAKGMEPFSEEAKAYADGRTQDVMPSHDETAAMVLSNKQVGGFLIMHGFKNTLYNLRQDALAKSVRDFHLADGAVETAGAAAKTAGRVALQAAMFGGFALMGKLAMGSGQQKDETKAQYVGRDFIGGQTADLPFIGGLGEPLGKLLSGIPARARGDSYSQLSRQDFSAYGNPGLALLNKAQETLGHLVNGGREDYKKVFDLVETALFGLGVPSRAPRVAAEHIYEQVTGQKYDDDGVTPGRLVFNERQWESVRRTLSPDED